MFYITYSDKVESFILRKKSLPQGNSDQTMISILLQHAAAFVTLIFLLHHVLYLASCFTSYSDKVESLILWKKPFPQGNSDQTVISILLNEL